MVIIHLFILWQAYIDFEISEGEFERTRELYERLLDRTKHLKVWISYAKFEASAMEEDAKGSDLAEDDLQEHHHEQKKQCIQHARSKEFLAKSYCLYLLIYNLIVFKFHHR